MLGQIINGTFTFANLKAWIAGLFLIFIQIQQDPASFLTAVSDAGNVGDAIVVGILGAVAVWAVANGPSPKPPKP